METIFQNQTKKIRIADHAGFCSGVSQAIREAEQCLQEESIRGRAVFACGDLIHNRQVMEGLEKQGLQRISTEAALPEGSVCLIRTHGAAEAVYQTIAARSAEACDLTCPFVAKIHTLVRDAANENRKTILIGEREHPEVLGTIGWAKAGSVIVSGAKEAQQMAIEGVFADGEWVCVAQTTLTQACWEETVAVLREVIGTRLHLHCTICSATKMRQKGVKEGAKWADCVVVIGDPASANTNHLCQLARNHCQTVLFVSNSQNLSLHTILQYDRILVAAGASTPERSIKEVISAMCEAITENKDLEQVEAVEDFKAEPATETKVEIEPKAKTSYPDDANDMASMMDLIEKSLKLPMRGEIVEGEVVQATAKQIVVNLGCKKDGIIPKDEITLEEGQELTDLFKEGDTIQAKVIKTDDGDGNILLSKKKMEVSENWGEITEALDNKEVVLAKVIKAVNGGVIAVYKEVSGFIPMSQLSDHYVEKADEFIGQTLECKVSRVDPKRNKAVFSHKAYLEDEKRKKLAVIWENLHVGDVVEGTVKRFTDYGAFVDIGGIDGLLHISEISWGKLKHPQEALQIEEKIPVKILSMNEEKGKISLGLKQNRPEPWSVIDDKYQVGQVIEGKVVQIKEYGAFVELEPGLDGLVHISEIAYKRVTNINEELQIGQSVHAEILEIDKERKRISLSIKKTLEAPAVEEAPAEEAPAAEAEEAPATEE